MDNAKFNDKLNKIFNLKESVQPEVVSIVKPEDSIEAFRGVVQTRLRSLKNQDPQPHTQVGPGAPGQAIVEQPSQVGPGEPGMAIMEQPKKIIDYPYPDPKKVTQEIGVQKSNEEMLNKLAEFFGIPRQDLSLSPKPFPTGETGVWLLVTDYHQNPDTYLTGKKKIVTHKENIGAIWPAPAQGGVVFRNHSQPYFAKLYGTKPGSAAPASPTSPEQPLKERENPISVGTIKSQVQNFGPEALGQIIAKLNPEMNKVDANGQPTSEYNQFVDSIKQDGLELVLNTSADSGGVKMGPNGGTAKPETPAPAPDVAPKEPGQELASL